MINLSNTRVCLRKTDLPIYQVIKLTLVVAMPFLFCSCLPVSDNPLLQQNGQTSITPYVGQWRVHTIRGVEIPTTCNVQVIAGATEIHRIVVSDQNASTESKIRLATLNGLVYGSHKYQYGHTWSIGKILLTGSGNTLEIRGLNLDIVATDVEASIISGKNTSFDDQKYVCLTASIPDLRTYIISHQDAFNTIPDVVLTKVP